MSWNIFKNPKFILFIILLVTIYAVIIDVPKSHIKFSYDYSHLKNIPGINSLVEGKTLSVDQEIGGYELNLFNGAFVRDLEIKKGLDIEGGISVILDADVSNVPELDRKAAIDSLANVIERRVNLLGISEAVVQSSKQGDKYRIIVELAGLQDAQEAIDAIGQTAQMEFRELKDIPIDQQPNEDGTIPEPVQDFVATELNGADLKKATVVFGGSSGNVPSNAPEIELQFTAEGARKFRDITERNIQKPLAIFLDDQLLMAPTVQTTISNGQAVITGQFTPQEAKTISAQLNAGALPIPVNIVEQKTVGPSLGQESVNKSVVAGMIGLLMVILFMIGYYGWLGVFASIALVIYGLVTLAIYKLVPVVLTLPGLTGFILSIGMAVDANILIFERIKEELRVGKPLSLALENGFGRSWDSIRDANTATLITAFILFNPFNWGFLPASGMVRGFALTLVLGIFISLFTGVFVTRNLVRVFYKPKVKNKHD